MAGREDLVGIRGLRLAQFLVCLATTDDSEGYSHGERVKSIRNKPVSALTRCR